MLDLPILLWLPVALTAAAFGCRTLPSLFKIRLPRSAIYAAVAASLVSVSPFFTASVVAGPSGILLGKIPGTSPAPYADRFEPQNDLMLQLLPWELQVRKSLASGALPFWSDRLDGGSCLWCNPQAQVLSPIALAARLLPFRDFLAGTLALKVFLAYLGAWIFLSGVGCRSVARHFGSGVFALGGGMSAWAFFPLASALAFAPWVAASILRLVRHPGPASRRFAAVAVATSLLAGHPEVSAISVGLSVLSAVLLRRKGSSALGATSRIIGPVVCAGLLAAPVLLPFALALPSAQRWRDIAQVSESGAGFQLWNPVSWFLPGCFRLLATPFHPHIFGTPYGGAFSGAFNWPESSQSYMGVGCVVALSMAWSGRIPRRARCLLAVGVGGLLIGWGFRPMAAGLALLPLVSAVAHSRFVPVALLWIVAASSIAAAYLRRHRVLFAPGVAVAILVALSLKVETSYEVIVSLLLLATALATLRWKPRLFWVFWITGSALDVATWAVSQTPRGPASAFYPPTDLMVSLGRRVREGGPWRVVAQEYEVYPNILSVFGIDDVRPHNPLADSRYLNSLASAFDFRPNMSRYFDHFRIDDLPYLSRLNVRFVVSRAEFPLLPGLQLDPELSAFPWRVYVNSAARPRFFVEAPSGSDEESQRAVRSISPVPNGYLLGFSGDEVGRVGSSVRYSAGWAARQGPSQLSLREDRRGFLVIEGVANDGPVDLRFTPPGLGTGLLALLAGSLLLVLKNPMRRW